MKSRSLLPGILLVVLGAAFFGETAHWWQLNWQLLAGLWPLYVIALGVRLVLPRTIRSDWLFAILMVVAGAAVISAPQAAVERLTGIQHENRTSSVSQASSAGLSQLDLTLEADASHVTLQALPARDSRVYTAVSHGAQLSQSYQNTNGQASATISQANSWLGNTNDITVLVARQPALTLHVGSDAGNLNIDASSLTLSSLKLSGDASNTTLKLGSQTTQQTLTLDGDASHVTISFPAGAGVRLMNRSELSQLNLAGTGLERTGDQEYSTSGFNEAKQQIIIECNGDISGFTLKRY